MPATLHPVHEIPPPPLTTGERAAAALRWRAAITAWEQTDPAAEGYEPGEHAAALTGLLEAIADASTVAKKERTLVARALRAAGWTGKERMAALGVSRARLDQIEKAYSGGRYGD